MALTFTEKIALKLRGLPVGRIEKTTAAAKEAGISLGPNDISAFLLAGGSIERVIEALILAKREGIPTSWDELCAIDLAGRGQNFDALGAVRSSIQVREMTFSTFAADRKEALEGICRDGSRTKAQCRVQYRLPVSHVFGSRMEFLQERLAARIAANIFDSATPIRLEMARSSHENSLLALAKAVMPTVQMAEVRYTAATNGRE